MKKKFVLGINAVDIMEIEDKVQYDIENDTIILDLPVDLIEELRPYIWNNLKRDENGNRVGIKWDNVWSEYIRYYRRNDWLPMSNVTP
ncbi:MAG: hypothetical protein ACOCQD_01965 [archaeon]